MNGSRRHFLELFGTTATVLASAACSRYSVIDTQRALDRTSMVILPRIVPVPPPVSAVADASTFFEDAARTMGDITVEPIFKDGLISNPKDLVPHRVELIPEKLTIYTAEIDDRSARPKNIKRPSENAIFVYAYNAAGKLIKPWYESDQHYPTNGWTYELFLFGQHVNRPTEDMPFLCRGDFDTFLPTWDPAAPARNPYWAIMVRPRVPGRGSVRVYARALPEVLKRISEAERLAQQGPDGAAATFTVDVLDGFQRIDTLGLFLSKPELYAPPLYATSWPTIRMSQGDALEIRAVGIKMLRRWDDKKLDYVPAGSLIVTPIELTWSFTPHQDLDKAGLAIVESLDGWGTRVLLTAVKADGANVGGGYLSIYGYGNVWSISVPIKK